MILTKRCVRLDTFETEMADSKGVVLRVLGSRTELGQSQEESTRALTASTATVRTGNRRNDHPCFGRSRGLGSGPKVRGLRGPGRKVWAGTLDRVARSLLPAGGHPRLSRSLVALRSLAMLSTSVATWAAPVSCVEEKAGRHGRVRQGPRRGEAAWLRRADRTGRGTGLRQASHAEATNQNAAEAWAHAPPP